MKIIYIAHPIGGDVQSNLEKIRAIVRDINLSHPGIVPFVPYYADCVSLDDNSPQERARGIMNNKVFFMRKSFDELWLYGDRISAGMWHEIRMAWSNKIPIISMSDGTKLWEAASCPSVTKDKI